MSNRKKKVVSTGNKKRENPKKKTVVTTSKKQTFKDKKEAITPTQSKRAKTTVEEKKTKAPSNLIFGKENYAWMLLGAGLVALGMFLMSGGSMPDPNTWDPDIIYSTRRTVLAPIVILAGLGVEVYAIFK